MNHPRPGEQAELNELHDERLAELYRVTRDIEPPAWLDPRILTAARTAVEPHSGPVVSWFRRRGTRFWAPPVALAATVALAVGLLRLLPPVSEPGGMPAMVEDKVLSSMAKSAAEQDAAPTQSIPPAAGAMRMAPPAVPKSEAPAVETRRREPLLQAAPPGGAAETKVDRRDSAQRWTPAEWRAEIARLRRQGRDAEAEARLAEFRRHYPDEPDEPLDDAAERPR